MSAPPPIPARCPGCGAAVALPASGLCPACRQLFRPRRWEKATAARPVTREEVFELDCPECGTPLDMRRPVGGVAWVAILVTALLSFGFVFFALFLAANARSLRSAAVNLWPVLSAIPIGIAFVRMGGVRFRRQQLRVCHDCGYVRLGGEASPKLANARERGLTAFLWLDRILGAAVLFYLILTIVNAAEPDAMKRSGEPHLMLASLLPAALLSGFCYRAFRPQNGHPVLTAVGHFWTLPNTLLGLFVGVILTRGVPRLPEGRGFLVFSSGRGISERVARAGPGATTFGGVVVFWNPDVADHPGWLDHEAVHVRQYLWLGPLFIPIYLFFLPFTGWRSKHPLEVPAYRASDPLNLAR